MDFWSPVPKIGKNFEFFFSQAMSTISGQTAQLSPGEKEASKIHNGLSRASGDFKILAHSYFTHYMSMPLCLLCFLRETLPCHSLSEAWPCSWLQEVFGPVVQREIECKLHLHIKYSRGRLGRTVPQTEDPGFGIDPSEQF